MLLLSVTLWLPEDCVSRYILLYQRLTERQCAEIATILATTGPQFLALITKYGGEDIPFLAKVKRFLLLAVDVTTHMRHLSWINSLDTLQPFGH
jgi:hypothetical protein